MKLHQHLLLADRRRRRGDKQLFIRRRHGLLACRPCPAHGTLGGHLAACAFFQILLHFEQKGPVPGRQSHHDHQSFLRQSRDQHAPLSVGCHADEGVVVALETAESGFVDRNAGEGASWVLQTMQDGAAVRVGHLWAGKAQIKWPSPSEIFCSFERTFLTVIELPVGISMPQSEFSVTVSRIT